MNIDYLDEPKLIKTYTINSPIDEFNIIQGKCPNYALNWGVKRNLAYWSTGHDFINGKYNFLVKIAYIVLIFWVNRDFLFTNIFNNIFIVLFFYCFIVLVYNK